MKIIILAIFYFLLASSPALAQDDAPKTARQLSAEITTAKSASQKAELLLKLRNMRPHSSAAAEELISVSRAASDKQIKESALKALAEVQPSDREALAPAYIKALDEKDWQTRGVLITTLGKLKASKAAPKLREILKEKPRKDELKMLDATDKEDKKSAWATYSSPALAARALGELKDEEAIPLLVSKYDDLAEAATESLAMVGKKAIPSLLELAKKEKGKSDNPATMVFAQLTDKTAKSDLLYILKNEENDDIRANVVHSLFTYMYDEEVLREIKSLYNKNNNSVFLEAMKVKSAVPFLIDVLKNGKDVKNRWYVVELLGEIGDKSAIPALEEALHDKRKDVRLCSADALRKLTGKD